MCVQALFAYQLLHCNGKSLRTSSEANGLLSRPKSVEEIGSRPPLHSDDSKSKNMKLRQLQEFQWPGNRSKKYVKDEVCVVASKFCSLRSEIFPFSNQFSVISIGMRPLVPCSAGWKWVGTNYQTGKSVEQVSLATLWSKKLWLVLLLHYPGRRNWLHQSERRKSCRLWKYCERYEGSRIPKQRVEIPTSEQRAEQSYNGRHEFFLPRGGNSGDSVRGGRHSYVVLPQRKSKHMSKREVLRNRLG